MPELFFNAPANVSPHDFDYILNPYEFCTDVDEGKLFDTVVLLLELVLSLILYLPWAAYSPRATQIADLTRFVENSLSSSLLFHIQNFLLNFSFSAGYDRLSIVAIRTTKSYP